MFLLAWIAGGGVSSGEWILVGLGVLFDVTTYVAEAHPK